MIKTRYYGWVEAQDLRLKMNIFGFGENNPAGSFPFSEWHTITDVRFSPKGNDYVNVYDLEVEEFNNFICEELCCHNSSSTPNVQQISGRVFVDIERPIDKLFE